LVSVSPGIIDTPMGQLEAANEPAMADMVSGSALARQGRPEEVAAVAVFLASDAASFVTGTDVLVDGGAVAGQRTAGWTAARPAIRRAGGRTADLRPTGHSCGSCSLACS
jgi:NAD(P)-dependent dehydrogenase (short-subunit alcohol dehydrogenase family)